MRRYVHRTILAILLVSPTAFCGLMGSRGLSTVLNQADTVVIATINTSNAISTDSAVTVNLTVQRVLKGSMSVPTTFTAQWPHNPVPAHVMSVFGTTGSGSGAFPAGRAGIWFLQQDSSTWRVLPLVGGDVPLDYLYISLPNTELPAAYAYDGTADPKKKLLSELEAAAVDSETSDMIAQMAKLGMLDDGLGSGLLKLFYDQLATSSQSSAKFIGIAGQIETGEPSGIAMLRQLPWKAIPPNAQALLALSVAHYRGADPTAIAMLGALAQSSDYHISTAPRPIMQLGAAHALREIHTRDTLPFLKTLLDSPNPTIRYDAVIGIAQYAMSLPVAAAGQKHAVMATFTPDQSVTNDMRSHYPAMDLFAKNEREYIWYWKGWLQEHVGQWPFAPLIVDGVGFGKPSGSIRRGPPERAN